MVKSNVDKLSLDLVRKSLAIASLEDVEDKEQDESARREYCGAIAAVFPRLERDIKKFLHDQLVNTSMKSGTWEEVLVGRGVFAGMEILLEHWKSAKAEYENRLSENKKEEFDRAKPVAEL